MMQAQLQKSDVDKRLLFLVNTIREMVWEADINGDIIYANDRWYEYIDREPGTSITTAWLDVIHPDDYERSLKMWQHSLKTGEPYEIEYRLRQASVGTYNWFVVRAMPYRSKDGNIERWYGTCTNIETQKENIALIEMNKTKDEFISIASHQLRTPATAVKQYIGMALEGYAGDLTENQELLLDKAYQNNERQLRIVTDLLRVAQVEIKKASLKKTPVDIVALVHTALNAHIDTFKSREQSVLFGSVEPAITTRVDIDVIRMVLDNLLENASKYTHSGGEVEVMIRQSDRGVSIEIADQGVGIAAEDEKKLFKRFSRIQNDLSTKVGGTGLGLYWAKTMMDLHGGTIDYRPNTPKGSVFSITLPFDNTNTAKENA